KSQTITSLIASSILKGENVLVVSEKKVALDVIYSRLKKASKYAMFIDDAENKQDFYEKLKKFLEPEPPVRTLNNDVYALDQKIKSLIDDMDQSLNLLYEQTEDNIPLNRIFEHYIKDKDMHPLLTPKIVYVAFHKWFNSPSFELISELEKAFDTDQHLKKFIDLAVIYFKYPWMLKLDPKVSRSSKLEFKDFHQRYLGYKDSIYKKGFFRKRSLTRKFIKDNAMTLSFLTRKKSLDKAYLKTLMKDDRLHFYILENLNNIDKFFFQFNALSADAK